MKLRHLINITTIHSTIEQYNARATNIRVLEKLTSLSLYKVHVLLLLNLLFC